MLNSFKKVQIVFAINMNTEKRLLHVKFCGKVDNYASLLVSGVIDRDELLFADFPVALLHKFVKRNV